MTLLLHIKTKGRDMRRSICAVVTLFLLGACASNPTSTPQGVSASTSSTPTSEVPRAGVEVATPRETGTPFDDGRIGATHPVPEENPAADDAAPEPVRDATAWPPSAAAEPAYFPGDLPPHITECMDIGLAYFPYLADGGDVDRIMAHSYAGSAWGHLNFALNEIAEYAEPGHTSPAYVVAEACRGWEPMVYTPPGPLQPDPAPVYPLVGELPDRLPAEVETCQDFVVYFSQELLNAPYDRGRELIETYLPTRMQTMLFGAVRGLEGDPLLYAHPWAVAERSCRTGPSA